MKFTVYADKLSEVVKRLDKLAVKAARYNVPFEYHVSDEHPQAVTVYGIDEVNSVRYPVNVYTVAAVDVEIESDWLIKANGWTLRAKCEHGDQGNIVSTIGEKPAELAWFTAPARCDHCKTNRFRAVTYFVEREDGAIRQVGRGCLHEYTGINPATAALWAEVNDLMACDFDFDDESWRSCGLVPMYDATTVIAHAYDAIKEFGYRKSEERESTKDLVVDRVFDGTAPTAEALTQAERIKAWLLGLDLENDRWAGDLERNCRAMLLGGYVKRTHFGWLAYLPIAYEKYMERAAAESEAQVSEHVGQVGERITVKTTTAKLLTSWDNDFGMTYLYKFTDEHGNVFIWYASRGIEVKDGMTLKGTVKDHNERDGVKQTVITRCKAA